MPAGSQARFNLVDDPWIPIVWHDGRYDRLGIAGVLADACRIRQLAAASPPDNFAVFRLLLAVLYWCRPDLASPRATATLDPTTVFLPDSFTKLTAQRSLFDLFGSGSRFYQDPACRQKQPRHTRPTTSSTSYPRAPACGISVTAAIWAMEFARPVARLAWCACRCSPRKEGRANRPASMAGRRGMSPPWETPLPKRCAFPAN